MVNISNDDLRLAAMFDPDETSNSQYPTTTQPPSDVKFDTGFGMQAGDVARGFADPGITQPPEHDLRNYRDRWNYPNKTDGQLMSEWDFRSQEQETKGFLTRNPNDRSR